jgi:hypothetical protein
MAQFGNAGVIAVAFAEKKFICIHCLKFIKAFISLKIKTHHYLYLCHMQAPVIFSQYTTPGGHDTSLGCAVVDWRRARPGVLWPSLGQPPSASGESIPWWHGRPFMCVWRGTATGAGITPATNIRLRAIQLGSQYPDLMGEVRGVGLNGRAKFCPETGEVHWIRPHTLPHRVRERIDRRFRLPMAEQVKRGRWLLNLDGNVGASRIGELLWYGALFLPDSNRPAVQMGLVAYKHYVPVAADLSNLVEQLGWARAHDEEVYNIAVTGHKFARHELSEFMISRQLRRKVLTLPPASDAAFMAGLCHFWTRVRSGIYVLARRAPAEILIFAPFCNDSFPDGLPPHEPAPPVQDIRMAEGYTMAELMRRESGAIPDVRRWWRNAGLVCTTPHPQEWGDSMIPELFDMFATALMGEKNPLPVFSTPDARDVFVRALPMQRMHRLYLRADIDELVALRREQVGAGTYEWFINKRDSPSGFCVGV